MQFKTIKPSRRALLSLAVTLTLAPVGATVHHLVTDGRTAATIQDLGDGYEGGIWSNKDLETQNTPATFEVASKTRTRFTGTLTIGGDGKGDEPVVIPVTGGVSSAGRVVLNGSVNQAPARIRVNVTGQLSAGGNALIGSYTATGRTNDGPLNDRGSVVLLLAEAPPKS